MPDYIEHIGAMLDQIITIEMRAKQKQGIVTHLHAAAVARAGGPVTLAAARLLQGLVTTGSTVLITTGASDPVFLPEGETDGPPGATALAAAVAYGLGAIPVLVTEKECVANLKATLLASGVGVRDYPTALRAPYTADVRSFPSDDSAAAAAIELLDETRPAVVIAIEKLGPNPLGVAHTATGMPASPTRARVEHLFDTAAHRRIPTIGVGDNGNEIGCGLITEAVYAHKPWGRICQCPCRGGIATRVATDILAIGSTSNWAAYGIVAALAALLGRPELIRTPADERRVLQTCAQYGAADGSTGRHVDWVDGTPPEVSANILSLMHHLVVTCSREPIKRGF